MDKSQYRESGTINTVFVKHRKLLIVGSVAAFALYVLPPSSDDTTDGYLAADTRSAEARHGDAAAVAAKAPAVGLRRLLPGARVNGEAVAKSGHANNVTDYAALRNIAPAAGGQSASAANQVSGGKDAFTTVQDDSDQRNFIGGRIMASDGSPVGDIRIVATPVRLSANETAEQRYVTRSDDLGYYQLKGLPAGEYTVRAAGRNELRPARIAAKTGTDYANLILAPTTPWWIEGYVETRSGEPLEGVAVMPAILGQASVLTDADGRFRMQLLQPAGVEQLAMRYRRPGFNEAIGRVSFSTSAHMQAGTLKVEKVVMTPVDFWTSVDGSVRDADGQALAGLRVELIRAGSDEVLNTRSGREGRFSFPAVAAPAEYTLRVSGGSAYRDVRRKVTTSIANTQAAADIDMTLQAYQYGAVSGRVVNQQGLPVPDFALVLRAGDSREATRHLSTNEQGYFSTDKVPAGPLTLVSVSDPSLVVQGLKLESEQRLHVPLVVDWGEHQLTGTVVDARNNPVPASRVLLRWTNENEDFATHAMRRTNTDAQGQFSFRSVGSGPHALRVDAPGHSAVDIDHDLHRDGYHLTVRLN